MNAVNQMSPSNEIAFARELTIKAIENNLISAYSDSEDTAKEITKFYKTVLATISQD